MTKVIDTLYEVLVFTKVTDISCSSISISHEARASIWFEISEGIWPNKKKEYFSGLATLTMAFWTSTVGLFICACVFGFFCASFGPTCCETLFIIVGQKHFNISYGFEMLFMGLGWSLGAPTAGEAHVLISPQWSCLFYEESVHSGHYTGIHCNVACASIEIQIICNLFEPWRLFATGFWWQHSTAF